jgi:hypothetical protein
MNCASAWGGRRRGRPEQVSGNSWLLPVRLLVSCKCVEENELCQRLRGEEEGPTRAGQRQQLALTCAPAGELQMCGAG